MSDSLCPTWFDALRHPATYPHQVTNLHFAETHISWIVLTGEWAYKLKKPVNFGFVDFTTLEQRRIACVDEVRLNQRTAPDIYDCVIALTDEPTGPCFDGTGPVLEYAVRMRQFDSEQTFDCLQARGELSTDIVESLARTVADLHQKAAVAATDSPFGEPASTFNVVDDCFGVLEQAASPADVQQRLQQLKTWFQLTWNQFKTTFTDRKRGGYVRECHGDLHLGNVVFYEGKPTLFDCLEFNAGLRWIDIASDIAFLVMDLHDRGAPSLAWRALNEWLQQTGDYGALQLLNYYAAYRALVRAKVAQLRLQQAGLSADESKSQAELVHSYLKLASTLTQPGRPAIILMHGVSGSGKSFVARNLAGKIGAIQIRSDVERKRIFGIWPANPREITPADLYGTSATEQTYDRLESLTLGIVAAKYPVIVDAAFLKQPQRQRFLELAKRLRIPTVIMACNAPDNVLRDRIRRRQQVGVDASDADLKILDWQSANSDPLTEGESQCQIVIDTTYVNSESIEQLVRRIQPILGEAH